MNKIIFILILLLSLSSYAKEASQERLPKVIAKSLQSSETQENYISQVLSLIRQNVEDKNNLTKDSIDKIRLKSAAQERGQQVAMILSSDSNGDGIVTGEEIKNNSATPLRIRQNNDISAMKYDKNKDGKITYEEMLILDDSNKRSNEIIKDLEELLSLDPNKDGKLTTEELTTLANKYFRDFDTDKDGVLSNLEKEPLQEFLTSSWQDQLENYINKIELGKNDELHVVGVYEGNTNNESRKPTVKILVNRPGKDVSLVINSHNPVNWEIQTSDKTKLNKIILSGNKKSESKILLNDKAYESAIDFNSKNIVYSLGINLKNLLREINVATGRDQISGFYGSYTAPDEGFIISDVSNSPDIRLKREVSKIPIKLPDIKIIGNLNGVTGEFDLSGKLLFRLPRNIANSTYKVVHVKKSNEYYILFGNVIVRRDAEGKAIEEIKPSVDIPPFSHPKGITYNSKNNQLIIASLGGEGFLYSYDLESKKWSVISSFNDKNEVQSISYDEKNNFYAGVSHHIVETLPIVFLDEKGKYINNIFIPVEKLEGFTDIYDKGNGGGPIVNIISKGDNIVLTARSRQSEDKISRIYLYNKSTDKAYLTWASD